MTYRPALYCTRRPGPPLDRFVERLWYWECEPLAHMKDRMMPDGSCGLVINLYEDETRSYSGAADDVVERYPGAVLCGTYSQRRRRTRSCSCWKRSCCNGLSGRCSGAPKSITLHVSARHRATTRSQC